MKIAYAVDVGNTHIKWGRCEGEVVREIISLPPDCADPWKRQWEKWSISRGSSWAIAGVHPSRCNMLLEWLQNQGVSITVLDSHDQLPLKTRHENPETTGIDRLLNAVAANSKRPKESAAVIVDAGSAVTVDYLDEGGRFCGGAIFPGFGLMAKALHHFTAKLPRVEIRRIPEPSGANTIQAIEVGVYWSVVGGIEKLVGFHRQNNPSQLEIFLTGGDASILNEGLSDKNQFRLWPGMTLTGILLSANHGLQQKS